MKSSDFKNLPKGILSRKDREAFMVFETFGISEEQQKAYEDEVNLRQQCGLRSSKPIQDLLGTAWGFWYDHDWCESMDKLKEYCDQHGMPYKYLDP
jgi:hypothetical protein